eukprot:g496.t1
MADARAAVEFSSRSHRRGVDLMVQEDGSLAVTIIFPHHRAVRRGIGRCLRHWRHWMLYHLWPASPLTLLVVAAAVVWYTVQAPPTSWFRRGWLAHFLWGISDYFPFTDSHPVDVRAGYLAAWASLIAFMFIMAGQRMLLRFLFSWKGWLRRDRAQSCATRCWAVLVRVLTEGGAPKLTYSFQGALPSLPVPSLLDTIERYLESVRPMLTSDEFRDTERLASDFLTGLGPSLQRYLNFKAFVCGRGNYISEWWEKYVYLKGRSSLMINSNYYIMDFESHVPTTRQAARAAGATSLMCGFCRLLDKEQIAPMRIRNLAPLCMSQYERMFATTRRPGVRGDVLFHRERARHIAVLCRGNWYRVDVVKVPSGEPVAAHELERQFLAIIDDSNRMNRVLGSPRNGLRGIDVGSSNDDVVTGSIKKKRISSQESPESFSMRRSHSTGMHLNRFGGVGYSTSPSSGSDISIETAERQIAALTSLPREQWAKIQEEHFSDGVNKISLREIERSLFVVVLDHGKHETLSERGAALFHGDGTNRWFDKSMQLIAFADGHIGLNAEHSWADAPVTGHMWEHVLCHESKGNSLYRSDGHTHGYKDDAKEATQPSELDKDVSRHKRKAKTAFASLRPQRLRFSLNPGSSGVVLGAAADARMSIQNLDLNVFGWNKFGKRFIKKCSLSPDAFLQMALQLAYYRDSGKRLALTYEASMTRLFKEGRTETVRSLTLESAEFVRAMADGDGVGEGSGNNVNRVPGEMERKRQLLRKACARHTSITIDAMSGHGLDRHLFALYVVATGMGEDSPFLKTALTHPWRLSTSQTPARQTDVWDLLPPEKLEELQNSVPGGGFGPVADDGYGVSYLVAGENRFFFHVSSKRSSEVTDSARFARAVQQALADMKALF